MHSRLLLGALLGLACFACGNKVEVHDATSAKSEGAGVDSYALFPPGAIGLGKLDVGALFRAGKSGEALGHLLSNYSPLGPESGFSLEHNVDRVICASYQIETADVLCVAEGRFDAKAIDKAVTDLEAQSKAEHGDKLPAVVRTPYAGRTLITVANVGFVVYDTGHALAGTENAMRRALDRTREGAVPKRDIPTAFDGKVVQSKADLAAAGNIEGAGFRALAFGPVKIRLLQGLREVYGEGSFKRKHVEPSATEEAAPADAQSDVTFVTHLVYADEGKAASSKDEVSGLLGFSKLGASMGYMPRLGRSEVTASGNETTVVLGFRDDVLARWIERAPEQFGLPTPKRSAGTTAPVPGADPPK